MNALQQFGQLLKRWREDQVPPTYRELAAMHTELEAAVSHIREERSEANGWMPPMRAQELVRTAASFKAFHANLCRRFGYGHDEKDWRRDLLSLEEHIAKQLPPRGVKMLRYDLSAAEVERELRAKLVEMGWRPPGVDDDVWGVGAWYRTYPRMDIYSKPGTLVMFDGRGGYEGEQEAAKKALRLRGVYEVEEMNVGSSSSSVKLRGHDGWFNTVMFSQAPERASGLTAQDALNATRGLVENLRRFALEGLFKPYATNNATYQVRDALFGIWERCEEWLTGKPAVLPERLEGDPVAKRATMQNTVLIADAEAASAEAFNNTFHKVRAEVSRTWWDRIWSKALQWARDNGWTPPGAATSPAEASNAKIIIERLDHIADAIRRMPPSPMSREQDFMRQRSNAWGAVYNLLDALHDGMLPMQAGETQQDAALRTIRELHAKARREPAPLSSVSTTTRVGNLVRTETSAILPMEDERFRGDPKPAFDIKAMVDRFLGWPLPKGFSPDCYITFSPPNGCKHPSAGGHTGQWPIGTNLFTAEQAREMFEYVLRPVRYVPHDGWTIWIGSERDNAAFLKTGHRWPQCPVGPGTKVRVRFRDGDEMETDTPEQMRWPWSRPYLAQADIIAFKIIK